MDEQRDERLWRIAKRRAEFQSSLVSFFIITAICWVIWYFTAYRNDRNLGTPWPLWVMLGFGIALLFKFLKAYKTDKDTLAEREYEKLKKQNP